MGICSYLCNVKMHFCLVFILEWNFLDVPVMLGYYIRGFHICAGVKVSYAINPMTYAAGTYNLSATNHNLGATFENMPDRGYTDYPCDSRVSNRLNVGAGLVGEIGYDLLCTVGQIHPGVAKNF